MLRPHPEWLVPVALLLLAACSGPAKGPAPATEPTASLPIRGERGEPSPKEDLSMQLGGMRLGMTVDDFVATCRGAGGTAARLDEIDLACNVAPVPLHFPGRMSVDLGGQIAGKFCAPGAKLCELVYTVAGDARHRDDQTGAIIEMLVGKYGPPSISGGHAGDDPMARCQKEHSVHFAREWHFGPQQTPPHPVGRVRLVFGCDLRVSADSHHLKLVYGDESGMRYGSAEHEQRRDNY